MKEANKQLSDKIVYKVVELLTESIETSNKFLKKLNARGCISEKTLKYFPYESKKTSNLGKLYLLPKILKRLPDDPGRPVTSNCGTPTEKVSEFLVFHLKPNM